MKIVKTMNFSASLDVEVGDGMVKNYASFTGSVSDDGVPTTSYFINDANTYLDHIGEFKTALAEFQNAVFAEADKVVAEKTATEQAVSEQPA